MKALSSYPLGVRPSRPLTIRRGAGEPGWTEEYTLNVHPQDIRVEIHFYNPRGDEIDSKGTPIPERTRRRGGGVLMTVSPVGHSPGPLVLSTIMGDDEDCIAEGEDDILG